MVSIILQCPQYVLRCILRNTTTTVNPKEFLPHFSRSATQRPRQHAPSSGQGCSSLHAVVNGRCTQKIYISHLSHRRSTHRICSPVQYTHLVSLRQTNRHCLVCQQRRNACSRNTRRKQLQPELPSCKRKYGIWCRDTHMRWNFTDSSYRILEYQTRVLGKDRFNIRCLE